MIADRVRSVNREPQLPTLRIGLLGIVPLHVSLTGMLAWVRDRNDCAHGLPIVEINCLPIWVIPGPEGSTVEVKLIRKDKVPILSGVLKRRLSVCALGCIRIDETDVVDQLGDLPR